MKRTVFFHVLFLGNLLQAEGWAEKIINAAIHKPEYIQNTIAITSGFCFGLGLAGTIDYGRKAFHNLIGEITWVNGRFMRIPVGIAKPQDTRDARQRSLPTNPGSMQFDQTAASNSIKEASRQGKKDLYKAIGCAGVAGVSAYAFYKILQQQ